MSDPLIPNTPYLYEATVDHVIDGDSVWLRLTKSVTIDFGFKQIDTVTRETTQNFRLSGINAAELKSPTRAAGETAKAELERLLGLGDLVVVTTKTGKYGRYLVDIYVTTAEGLILHVNDEMLKCEFVVPYGDPVPVTWYDTNTD